MVCSATNWYDIVWFYFANYILHALSVRSLPGENLFTSIVFKFACLIVPYTGIRRGLCLISRAANLTVSDLQSAARANALCMVVRTNEWRPMDGEEIEGCSIERVENTEKNTLPDNSRQENADVKGNSEEIKQAPTSSTVDTQEDGKGTVSFKIFDTYKPSRMDGILERTYRIFIQTYKFSGQTPSGRRRLDPDDVKVHGLCKLAPGYGLSYVPEDVKIFPRYLTDDLDPIVTLLIAIRARDIGGIVKALTSGTRLASTQNAPRILFSFIQTLSAGWSLYRAQGKQIETYGYAAYGLTVLPYMIVSIVNFLGSLLTREYEMVYMVHSKTMEEMIRKGGIVDGFIGSLEALSEESSLNQELVVPEGSTLQFQSTLDLKVTYRSSNSQEPNTSEALSINPPPSAIANSLSDAFPHEHFWIFYHWPLYAANDAQPLPKSSPPAPTQLSSPSLHTNLSRAFPHQSTNLSYTSFPSASSLLPWQYHI